MKNVIKRAPSKLACNWPSVSCFAEGKLSALIIVIISLLLIARNLNPPQRYKIFPNPPSPSPTFLIYITRIRTGKAPLQHKRTAPLSAVRFLTFIIYYSALITCNYTINFGPSLLFINSYKYAGLCT